MTTQLPSSATEPYRKQGAGIGAGALAWDWLDAHKLTMATPNVLEVGCGAGDFVMSALAHEDVECMWGVDIANEALARTQGRIREVYEDTADGRVVLSQCDLSHARLGAPDDFFDLAVCTEMIEHTANPYHVLAEVKRTLKHGGIFVISFPMPEVCLGYGPWKHAHIYPGLYEDTSFNTFMKQLYFAEMFRDVANNYIRWIIYTNYKGEDMKDIFTVMAADVDESKTYGMLPKFAEETKKACVH